MEMSKAVILAAGKGEKFYPFSYFRPKPMFPVCNKPILEHILDKLVSTEIKEICIVVGYRKGRIKNYFGSGKRHNCNITYVEQKEPLGTADALLKAENFTRDEPFVLVYGDLVFGEKVIPSILKAFTGKELGVAWIKEVDEPWKYTTVAVDKGILKRTAWKARIGHFPSKKALTGVYVFSPDIYCYADRASEIFLEVENGVAPPQEYDLADSLNVAAREGESVKCIEVDDYWIDVDVPWQVFDANDAVFKEMENRLSETYIHEKAEVSEKAVIKGKVYISEGVIIEDNVRIEGPVWLGKNTRILNGAHIYGPTVIGEECIIGPYCEVSGCIGNRVRIGHCAEVFGVVLDYSWIVHFSHICGILGERSEIGAGTITGTLRFDDEPAKVLVKGIFRNAGYRGNCIFFGDYSRTGVGALLMPGRIVGPCSIVGPGVMLMHNLPPFKIILKKEGYEIRDWNPSVYDKV